jgi:catechol 2,3-dioxygenase-like lactoylglutathione lyase family enzyme
LEGWVVTGLSRVFLLVSNLARSVQFYQRLLERAPASEDARHARFDLGPISLTIHEDLTPAEVSLWRVDPRPSRRGWGVYLTFPTADLEGTYEKVTAIGAEILTAPRATSWGTMMFIVKDPDGYLLEISQQH